MQPDTESVALARLKQARTVLLTDKPLYGAAAIKLNLKEDPLAKTVWCDGVNIGFNKKFVQRCTAGELKGVVLKMAMSAMLGHNWRCGRRDPAIWSEACDYSLVDLLTQEGAILPGVLRKDERFKGWAAEASYNKLLSERLEKSAKRSAPADESQDSSQSEEANPKSTDAESDDTSEEVSQDEADARDEAKWRSQAVGEIRPCPAGLEHDVRESMNEALAQGAMLNGGVPGHMNIAIAQAKGPMVDWQEYLHQFAQASIQPHTEDWSRPNRRYSPLGLYLPTMKGEQTPPFALILDVSGSVVSDKKMTQQFLGALGDVVQQCDPLWVDLVCADAAVQSHVQVKKSDFPEINSLPGGGGTLFGPAFEFIDKSLEVAPCCAIYLTDLQGTFPSEAPEYPVLWVVPDSTGVRAAESFKVPFGDVIVYPSYL